MPPPSLVLARIRLRWHRRAVATWALVVVLAATAGFLVASGGSSPTRAEPASAVRRVVVVTAEVRPGDRLDGKVGYRRRPTADVPDGALTTMPQDRVATVALHRGEVLVGDRVSGSPGAGPAALLRPGFRGVTVPLPDSAPRLRVGDRVDVISTAAVSPLGAVDRPDDAPVDVQAASKARVVAPGVAVIDARPGAVTVSVPAEQAPAVAAAVGDSSVTVVFAGPASPGPTKPG